MNLRISAAAACAVALTGCTSLNRAMEYDPTVHRVQTEHGVFRVFDHPDENVIMTTPSVGESMAQGVVRGATFGIVSPATPEQQHEAAARKWLDETGRENCKIVSGYLLVKPQYEFTFECTAKEPEQAEAS